MFDRAKLSFVERFQVRTERIRKEGSPYYSYIPGAIAFGADDYIYLDTQFPQARKYSPLDWVEIANNDAVDVTITMNGGETLPVPAGVLRTIDGKALRTFNIHNDDGAVNSTPGKIVVTFQREPITTDKLARRLA